MNGITLDPYDVFRIIIALVFALMAVLVVSRNRHAVNYAFALTPVLYTIWAILDVLPFDPDFIPARIIIQFIFLAGPLGILVSVLLIIRGGELRQDIEIWLFIAAYLVMAQVLGLISLYGEYQGDTQVLNTFRGSYNLIICLPLLVSLYYFYHVQQLAPEQRLNVAIILTGLVLALIGQGLNGIFFVISGEFITIAFVLIILGLITACFAFVSIPDLIKRTVPGTGVQS